MNKTLSDFALFFCPTDFRRDYRDQFMRDDDSAESDVRRALDLAVTGIALRWEMVVRDLSLATRLLWKAPLFSIVAVLAIALSVGANVAVATIVGALLVRPLPFPNAQQLLFVQETGSGRSVSYPTAQTLASRIRALGETAIAKSDTRTLSGRGRAEDVQGVVVSTNYLATLGVRPRIGRLFTSASASNEIVISSYLWQKKFGGDPAVLEQTARLNGRDYRIVGVTSDALQLPSPYGIQPGSFFMPIDLHDSHATSATSFDYWCLVRVHAGLDSTVAASTIERTLATMFAVRLRANPTFFSIHARPLRDVVLGPYRPILWTLYAASLLVLLIACTNVANLYVSRNSAREGQFAIRSALGATRRRIAVELAMEMAVLATVGGAAGLFVAWVGIAAIGIFGAHVFPLWNEVRLDGLVLVYAALLVLIITFAAGILPAFAQRRDLIGALRSSSHVGQQRFAGRLRTGLVIIEIALAMTLTICAGLVLHSFVALSSQPLGFTSNGLLVAFTPTFPPGKYDSDAARLGWTRSVDAALQRIPGVRGDAVVLQPPVLCCSQTSFTIPARGNHQFDVSYTTVSPTYFSVMQIPLLRGRVFSAGDRQGLRPVALVDETLARQYFGTLDVVGRTLKPAIGKNEPVTIVGVVAGVRSVIAAPYEATLYLPVEQDPEFGMFVVRTDDLTAKVRQAIDAAFERADPTLAAPIINDYAWYLAEFRRDAQTRLFLFASLAAIAVFLALSGVYAVSAFSVEQRRREFGVRKALGATTGVVLRHVLSNALATSAIGIGIGTVLSAVAARSIGPFLFETSPWDPITFGSAVALFLICALVSALAPAVRAMRVDPAVALRSL